MQICENIRLARISKDYSQQYMADKMNVPRGTYRNWEEGTEPTLAIIKTIAGILEIPAYKLLTGIIDFTETAKKSEQRPDIQLNIKLSALEVDKIRFSLNALDLIFSRALDSGKGKRPDVQDVPLADNKISHRSKSVKVKRKGIS